MQNSRSKHGEGAQGWLGVHFHLGTPRAPLVALLHQGHCLQHELVSEHPEQPSIREVGWGGGLWGGGRQVGATSLEDSLMVVTMCFLCLIFKHMAILAEREAGKCSLELGGCVSN